MSRHTSSGTRSPERGSDGRKSFITPGHVRAFQMVVSGRYEDNLSLTSCLINGEPGVAIVLVDQVSEGQVAVMPLFVAITKGMNVEFSDESNGGEEGGGPARHDARRAFADGKTMLEPGGG